MSWNITVSNVKRGDVEEKLDEAAEAYWLNLGSDAKEEAKDQFAEAKTAVLNLLDVVQTGAPDDPLQISLAGHANPDHGLANGKARESTMVSVMGIG